jgi:hypothetical protein
MEAGSTRDRGGDLVTLAVRSWTDSEITLDGFRGAYGQKNCNGPSNCKISPGDEVTMQIWNTETAAGPASFSVRVRQGAGSEDAPRGQNVPGAQAQIESVKAIFEKYNLLGVSAQDCTKPPKAVENWYYVNRLIDANHVQRDLMESPATRKSVTIIDNAAEATPNGILVIGTRDGKPAQRIWRLEKDRMVQWESALAGQQEISAGKWVRTGTDMPWLYRCGAPGQQHAGFPGRYRRRAGARYDSIADGNGPIGRKDQGLGTRRFRQILRAAARGREDHDATREWKRDDGRIELSPASEYHAWWRATMRRILRAVLYYESEPKFKGLDQFKYQRINEDNPNDRLNGEIILTVTVK